MHSDDCTDVAKTSPKAIRQYSSLYTYTRTRLLELRNLPASQAEPDEKTSFRNSRLFPKLFKSDSKPQQRNLREPENNGIVLGPQKRSWNIGCHVAEPKRGPNETSSTSKLHKPFADRSAIKKSDSSRESNYIDGGLQKNGRKKEKSFSRATTENSFYARSFSQTKSNSVAKFGDKPAATNQKEPEWFSGGPATVDETIELGGILNTDKEKPVNRMKKESNSLPKVNADLAPELTKDQNANPCLEKRSEVSADAENPPALEIFDLEFLRILERPKSEESGSHFRHLFTKSESNDCSTFSSNTRADNACCNKSNDINPDLLKFLSYSHDDVVDSNAKSAKQVKNSKSSANDLETALRSILLVNEKEPFPSTTDYRSAEGSRRLPKHMPPSDPAVVSTSRSAYTAHMYNHSVQGPNEIQNQEHLSLTKEAFESLFDGLKHGCDSSSKNQNQQPPLWDDALVSISLTPRTDINNLKTNLNLGNCPEKEAPIRPVLPSFPLSPSSLSFFSNSSDHENHSFRRPIVKSLQKADDINVTQPFFNAKSNLGNFAALANSRGGAGISNFQPNCTSESHQNIRDLQILLNSSQPTFLQSERNKLVNSKQLPSFINSTTAFPKSDFSMPPPYYPFYSPPVGDAVPSSLENRSQRSTFPDSYTSRSCHHGFTSNCCVSEPLSSMHLCEQRNLDSFRNASSSCSSSGVFKSAAF